MKAHLFGVLLAVILIVSVMSGCQTERTVESAGNGLKQAAAQATETIPEKHAKPGLTLQEVQNIALNHAGFAADQVTALRGEYEIEHGVPQYDVEFRHGYWEYDYEIHADTGEILSYSKDD